MQLLRGELSVTQRVILARARDVIKHAVIAGQEFHKPFDVVITALGWQVSNITSLYLPGSPYVCMCRVGIDWTNNNPNLG